MCPEKFQLGAIQNGHNLLYRIFWCIARSGVLLLNKMCGFRECFCLKNVQLDLIKKL